ncbi:hypothetical protein FOA43_000855 [Brettanomyces nanus]|uniref:Phosphoglucomutase n=1 Tax=Eeniella nana TaxID=13502 RepID=A0A875RY74_EENNA|nr:uncharacterized protein FOA43_000855 [Brettanomyces nanus]QPG73543.1 hypothetical protein FOA43_000855 [Brettanomyces nanus]
MASHDALLGLAHQWLQLDVNPSTRAEIQRLVDQRNFDQLDARLSNRIVFGTAGLRSKMEAGFSRINDVTILQASQGLARYILSISNDSTQPTIVVGHDHRHNSERYANLAAAAFLHFGFKVYYLGPGIIATPIVPFAVDYYHALGGVMITSSHNPKEDNGYKVYSGNGCQIIAPHDSGIQQCILKNLRPFFNDGEWNTAVVFDLFKDRLVYCKSDTVNAYMSAICKKLITHKVSGFRAVYTPMHGVGAEFAEKIDQMVSNASENLLVMFPEQAEPDPDFPTVSFPNPEEKGALDLGISKAEELGISLVLANDPDADRFSVAVKSKCGEWRQLTGNEIGFLFADYIASQYSREELSQIYMINSTVSSQLIGSMAKKLGFHYVDTLTGFKWIGNKAIELEKKGLKVPFAFEEAIGFMFDVVHDKDGLSALTVFLQMYQYWLRNGENAVSKLENGYKKFGYYCSCNGYYRTSDVTVIPSLFNEVIRGSTSSDYPKKIAEFEVSSWRDLTLGYESTTVDNKPLLPVDSSSQMITCVLKGGEENTEIRFTARGSGTEPKLKVYIEAKSDSEKKSRQLAQRVWVVLREQWFEPDKNGFIETVM